MRVPLSWLKEYVAFDLTPSQLADRLTFSGMEVEAIETIGAARPGVIVGEIREVGKHPNADKLTICKVFDGQQELSIVCGAPNVAVGAKVPLAPVGVTLPNGLKIKPAKIRGEPSAGMLCAEDELGISDAHTGLLIFPAATAAGTPVDSILPPPETVLVIEVTPNRSDCLSMIGIAREVAALLRGEVKMPAIRLEEGLRTMNDQAAVTLDDSDGCPRYTARVINGIAIKPSPAWMQSRLVAAGVRPINNIVDITNYVMLECGQPLHAFDWSLLEGHRIIVRRARDNEPMATLDGQPRPLSAEMLVIADANRPVALAGVMGGAGSEIRDTTCDVLLESACFKPTLIRKTSKKVGLMTESSYRYERGVDPNLAEWASRRAAALMAELGGGTVARGLIDCYPNPPVPKSIRLRYARARDVIGVDYGPVLTREILSALQLVVSADGDDACRVTVPTFRFDLVRESDLIEELARIHGLDKIPAPSPASRIIPGVDNQLADSMERLRTNLVGLGLREIMNYSFVSEKLVNLVDASAPRVKLPNPISADHTILRDSLMPQMLATLGRNRAHQVGDAALFEVGRVYSSAPQGGYREENRLCIGLMGLPGRIQPARTCAASEEEVLQWIKGIFEALCKACNVKSIRKGGLSVLDVVCEKSTVPGLAPDASLGITIGGQAYGVVGLVAASIRAEWRLVDPVAILEVALEPLTANIFAIPAMRALPAFPAMERDLALVVDETVMHRDVIGIIMRVAPVELIDMRLFDIYKGKGIAAGKKSMAYAFTYRSATKTLTDDDANRIHQAITDALVRDLSAEIRK